MVIGGHNYGQGSSREHAALAPRYLGLRVVIAKSFARIHHQNLANFGVLPLVFSDEADYDRIEQGDVLHISDIEKSILDGSTLVARDQSSGHEIELHHHLSARQIELFLAGGLIEWMKKRIGEKQADESEQIGASPLGLG